MSTVARPTRTSEPALSSAQIIANGASTDPMNLPAPNRPTRSGITGAQSATNQILDSMNELDDSEDSGDSDTDGFLFNDDNIFESGGLNKSDPTFLKRYRAGFPKKKFTPIADIPNPGTIFNKNGNQWEFVGYLNDIKLPDDDLKSFEPYEVTETSDFLGIDFNKIFGVLKKSTKKTAKRSNLPSVAGTFQNTPNNPDHVRNGLALIGEKVGSNLGFYRRKLEKGNSSLLQPFEYAIGDDPFISNSIGSFFKKVGKGIGSALKWTNDNVLAKIGGTDKASMMPGTVVPNGKIPMLNMPLPVATGTGSGLLSPVAPAGLTGLLDPNKVVANQQPSLGRSILNKALDLGTQYVAAQINPANVANGSTPSVQPVINPSTGQYYLPQQPQNITDMYPEYGNQLVASGAYQNGQNIPTPPASNKNTYLIIAVIAAVVILGGLLIYKSK